jgi:hypothetical protein
MSRFLLLSALILVACGRMPRSSSASDSAKHESASSEESGSKESTDSSKSDDSEPSDDSETKRSSSNDKSQISVTKPPPGPTCLTAQGEVQECMTDADCCPNFYCGIDPDGSTRIKSCLYGGK